MEQLNKFGLQMFYTADMENVYYSTDMDCFIVAEIEENTLLLQKSGGKAHGFNRGMKAKKLFAIIGQ
ncbi:MAG: hypothetical protein ACLTRS_00800 [Lachnospiraceae bacterium]